MVGAYNVFANQGVYVKPRMVRRIVDQTDRVLEEQLPEISEATQAQVAYELAHVMRGTIDRGTAYEAHVLPPPLAGKTGTTNAYTDAWFIGFSPEYSVGVWVGYDDPSRSLGGGASGAAVALPIWIDIFKQIDVRKLRVSRPDFDVPSGIVMVPMDLKTGRRGVGPCTRVVMEAFIAGQEPDKDCSGATVAVSKLPYYLQRPFYQPKELEPTQADPTPTRSRARVRSRPFRTSTRVQATRPPLRRLPRRLWWCPGLQNFCQWRRLLRPSPIRPRRPLRRRPAGRSESSQSA